MIETIRVILDKNNINRSSMIWTSLNHLIAAIEFLHESLKIINNIVVWKDLMKDQLSVLKTVFDSQILGSVKEQKNKLDEVIRQSKSGSHKNELIEILLQPRLIQVLLKQLKIDDFAKLSDLVLSTPIESQSAKEAVLYKCNSLLSKNAQQKRIGLSLNGFHNKYQGILGLDNKSNNDDFAYLLNKIFKKEKSPNITLDILNDYFRLLEQKSTWSFAELDAMFDVLCNNEAIEKQANNSQRLVSILLKLENVLSNQYETSLKRKLGVSHRQREFEQVLGNVVRQRLAGMVGLRVGYVQLREMCFRKSAFYAQLGRYCNLNENYKEKANFQKLKDMTLLATFVMDATMPLDEVFSEELFKQDMKFFKSIKVKCVDKKKLDRKPLYDAFEEVVFNIGKIQLDMLNLSLKPPGDQQKKRQEEIIKLEKSLSSLIGNIANEKSNGCALKGLKNYVAALNERKQDENRKKAISDILRGNGSKISLIYFSRTSIDELISYDYFLSF